tara:strand:+ start:1506 stop:1742 length:237 start_codon:yes stop_codon:yes gene_type:complete
MEENNFLIASAIAVVFAITKFIEKRFVLKDENLVLKDLLRDFIMVYVSSVIGLFIIQQVNETVAASGGLSAFTGKPDF